MRHGPVLWRGQLPASRDQPALSPSPIELAQGASASSVSASECERNGWRAQSSSGPPRDNSTLAMKLHRQAAMTDPAGPRTSQFARSASNSKVSPSSPQLLTNKPLFRKP